MENVVPADVEDRAASATQSTLSFFHDFRRFATKLASDAAAARTAAQEPPPSFSRFSAADALAPLRERAADINSAVQAVRDRCIGTGTLKRPPAQSLLAVASELLEAQSKAMDSLEQRLSEYGFKRARSTKPAKEKSPMEGLPAPRQANGAASPAPITGTDKPHMPLSTDDTRTAGVMSPEPQGPSPRGDLDDDGAGVPSSSPKGACEPGGIASAATKAAEFTSSPIRVGILNDEEDLDKTPSLDDFGISEAGRLALASSPSGPAPEFRPGTGHKIASSFMHTLESPPTPSLQGHGVSQPFAVRHAQPAILDQGSAAGTRGTTAPRVSDASTGPSPVTPAGIRSTAITPAASLAQLHATSSPADTPPSPALPRTLLAEFSEPTPAPKQTTKPCATPASVARVGTHSMLIATPSADSMLTLLNPVSQMEWEGTAETLKGSYTLDAINARISAINEFVTDRQFESVSVGGGGPVDMVDIPTLQEELDITKQTAQELVTLLCSMGRMKKQRGRKYSLKRG